jgi:tripartite-type tricarboxylate transporter receptor subunit TctC
MKASLLALIAAFLPGSLTAAQSQAYPNRPIRLITHAVAGAANDVMNRPQPSSGEHFAALIKSETAKWAKVVKQAGILAQ